jgi:LacI family repressor for deo operon, udp, cdd, tsx, nupC, and nupG
LYALGHRRIGVVTGPMTGPLTADRLLGVRTQAAARRAEGQLQIRQGDFTHESGEAAAEQLLRGSARPTAIFCFNDEMAFGVMAAARRKGLRVPRDLSIVGFDDIRFARHTDPPLTTVTQPTREIGEGTVRLLLGILSGSDAGPTSLTLPHELTVRQSTAPPPAGPAA